MTVTQRKEYNINIKLKGHEITHEALESGQASWSLNRLFLPWKSYWECLLYNIIERL